MASGVLDDPVLAEEIDALIGRRVEAAIRMATPNEEIGLVQALDADLGTATVLVKGRLVPQIAIGDRVPVEGDRVLVRTDQSTGLRYIAIVFGRPLDESGGGGGSGTQVSYPNSPAGVADYLARIKLAADANYRLKTGLDTSDNPAIEFGPGSAGADVRLRRTSAGVLVIDDNAGGDATLAVSRISFPATPNLSTDVNTLDEYEEGQWTPVLTFATPGNLSVAYSDQAGRYIKIGSFVWYWCRITTSTFTHTTASGNLLITGLPFTPANINQPAGGAVIAGYTKANYTSVAGNVSTAPDAIRLIASGSGQAQATLTTADFPTGGTVVLRVGGFYNT